MGVTYSTCNQCNETYPDCSRCGTCECERGMCGYCYDKMCEKYGTMESDGYGTVSQSCDICSLATPDEHTVLAYALKLLGRTREDVETELRLTTPPKEINWDVHGKH